MKVYGIKNCASVKKAKAFFEKNGISYEFIDLDKISLSKDAIEKWQSFVPACDMLNPRSKAYRDLKLKDKNISEKTAFSIIENDNSILKRPIIEHGLNGEEKFTIGFNEKEYNSVFLQ